jgi:hypothetical protein
MLTASDDRWFMVVITDPDGSLHALSRRLSDDIGTPFEGPWGALTQDEADGLADAFNLDPREGGTAQVVEVHRFDGDPVWRDPGEMDSRSDADKVLAAYRAEYLRHGYMYSGSMGPDVAARLAGIGHDAAWAAIGDLVKDQMVQRRDCEAWTYELPAAERVRLIGQYGLRDRWERTGACFYPNSPEHGEVFYALREWLHGGGEPPVLAAVPAPQRGSGPVTCDVATCRGHRDACLFGKAHTWAAPWCADGKVQRTLLTFHCYTCGGVCTGEEQDLVGEVYDTGIDGLYQVVSVRDDGIWCQRQDHRDRSFQVHPQHFITWKRQEADGG